MTHKQSLSFTHKLVALQKTAPLLQKQLQIGGLVSLPAFLQNIGKNCLIESNNNNQFSAENVETLKSWLNKRFDGQNEQLNAFFKEVPS